MKFPSWTMKLAAAAVIPIAVGATAALSAPSFSTPQADVAIDENYRPGEFGVDFAAVTGPLRSASEDASEIDCEHVTWPNIPAKCLSGSGSETPAPIRILR